MHLKISLASPIRSQERERLVLFAFSISTLLGVLLACGCQRNASTSSSGWPAVFHFSVAIAQENPEVEGSRLHPIARYLEKKMGIPVEISGTTNYGAVIEAFRAKKIEASTLGPFAYVIGSERAGIEALATRGSASGEPMTYSSTLCVPAGSRLQSMSDMITKARELTVSFVDPASTSGNLVPRAYLETLGLDPERDFKKVVYSMNHMASAMTLVAGKVDLAAVNNTTLTGLLDTGKLRAGEIRRLWTSPGIPESPLAVRRDLPPDFKSRLQKAMLDMATEAPDAYINMSARIYFERYRRTKFVVATDADYAPVRKLAESSKLLREH